MTENLSSFQDSVYRRLEKIEHGLRLIKDNDLRHIESRLSKVEEGLNWVKPLLFSIIGILITSSIGIMITILRT